MCALCTTFNTVPLPTFTNSSVLFNTTMTQTYTSVTSSGSWGGNTIICGYAGNASTEPWPDITQSDCIGEAQATMPTTDLYPNPGAGTVASRVALAGLLGYSSGDMRVTPTSWNRGGANSANIPAIISALGIVDQIANHVASTTLQVSYNAPDTNACSIDVWTGAGTPARFTYSGAATRAQSITATGLTAATSYNVRLMCAFAQIGLSGPDRPWYSFPSDPSNQQTEFIANTTASGTGTGSVGFAFPSGATSAVMTGTPLTGSPITQTCSSSPCVFSSAPIGDYALSTVYKTGGGAQVSAGSGTWFSVR
jgi:hypothetical protein